MPPTRLRRRRQVPDAQAPRSTIVFMSTARYVRWQDGEMWLGYFEQFPDYLTQGESLRELEENLRDLTSGEIPGVRSVAELAVE